MEKDKKNKLRIQVFVEDYELKKMREIQEDFSKKGYEVSLSNVARQLIFEGLKGK